MKRFFIMNIVILLLFGVFYTVVSASMDTYGIDEIETWQAYESVADTCMVKLDDSSLETIHTVGDGYLEQLHSQTGKTCVLVVTAGNAYQQKAGAYIQDAVVERVIAGAEADLEGEKISLTRSGGLEVSDGEIRVSGIVNAMQPGEEYLVFCEKSELSDMLRTPLYRILTAKFSCLRMDADDETTVEDVVSLNDATYAMYQDCRGHEFLTASEDTLDALIEIKHEILEQYGCD